MVGKFSPLHKGHEYLIETASQACDELVVISYSRPEFPSCSVGIRDKWLKRVTSEARVLCVDASTIELWRKESAWSLKMPLNSDSDEAHRKFTYRLLIEKLKLDIDAVYTSEDYGEGFAQYLSHPETGFGSTIEHVCVDIDRLKVPVSGTSIRQAQSVSADQVSKAVFKDFQVQKVCFLGGESTGKSTLSEMLAKEFGEPFADEYGRTLWEQNNGVLTPDDLIRICKVQTRKEDEAQADAEKYIFCDTSPLTTLCYSEALFKERPDVIEAFSERPYHHVFLCAPDFPLIQDGTRQDEEFRQWQHHWYLEELKRREIPYTRLFGGIDQRLEQVRAVLESYKNLN